jgi:hypothetical protein
MSERPLEVVRQPDGRFLASSPGEVDVEVKSWEDVRRLRGKRHLADHWTDADRLAFIELYGHPFDAWWSQLSPAAAAALLADPSGSVAPEHIEEVKRTLRHESRQTGLGLDGSRLTEETQAFVAAKASQTA